MSTPAINWHDETTRRYLTGSVARPEPGDTTRRAFYVDEEERGAGGLVPMLVTEDEPGYRPMHGRTPEGTWFWGATLDEAQAIADLVNAELFGLTPDEALDVVGSSMEAQEREDAAR